MAHVGEYIKHLRLARERSMTLERLSELCGLSVSFLSDIQRGVSDPSLDSLIKIANVFNLGAGDLLVKAGYTVNPALAWECRAKYEIICQEGELIFQKL